MISLKEGKDKRRLYKMNKDGSNKIQITDEFAQYTNYVNGEIYFVNEDQNICCIDDGKIEIIEDTENCSFINVTDNKLYYCNSDNTNEIYSIELK